MARMRLLVHVAGEADLLLKSQDHSSSVSERADQTRSRRSEIEALLDRPEGAGVVRRMLTNEAPQAGSTSIPGTSPVLGALDTLATTPDLTVLIIGTSQRPPGPLDTLPIAHTLAKVLTGIHRADESYPVQAVTVLPVAGLAETLVVDALIEYLGEAPQYEQALVTWGSGATTLTLGALTALSRAGLPWQLVLTSDQKDYPVVDPLEQLDIDPVAGVFIRWRMFAALDQLDRTGQLAVPLRDAQRDLVRQAAKRCRDGFGAQDCASVRAVLADAVVRRDGTASLAVRRYITSRYEELLCEDQKHHPEAEDLLRKYEDPKKGGPPIGGKLAIIREAVGCDPVVDASVELSSYKWLFSKRVAALQCIGKGSHTLREPAPEQAKLIGEHLSRHVEESGWWQAELPEPPVTPADTTLVVWAAGTASRPEVRSVGEQVADGLPTAITDFLGVEQARVRAVIFGVDDGEGSRERADQDVALIHGLPGKSASNGNGEAWVELTGPIPDPAAIEEAIKRRLTRETGALLLVPTGRKPILLALLRAMRRIGARHGLPLFVRQNAIPASGNIYDAAHLWPALIGGDRPLLNAAKGALRALELDVAWRLLAASAIGPTVTNQARQLADTFASRRPPAASFGKLVDEESWTKKLITQRLEMVEAALAHATDPADHIRLLVLAADAMEASIAAIRTQQRRRPITGRDDVTCRKKNGNFDRFKSKLRQEAEQTGGPEVGPAQILLLLNKARDRAPITHGADRNPDAVVREAVNHQAAQRRLSSTDLAPRDVPTLLRRSVAAAAERGFGEPGHAESLLRLQEKIIDDIDLVLAQRDVMPKRIPSARTASTAEGRHGSKASPSLP